MGNLARKAIVPILQRLACDMLPEACSCGCSCQSRWCAAGSMPPWQCSWQPAQRRSGAARAPPLQQCPTIAEEDANCGAYSSAASPPPAAPLFTARASCLGSPAMPGLSSNLKQEVHLASLPGQNGAHRGDSSAAHSRAGRVQHTSSAENGDHGHADISKEPLASPTRADEAQQLPSKGAEAPAVPASEVFREHQPCRRPAKPLQGFATMPVESATGGLHASASVSGLRESSSYIEGRVGGSYVKLAQLHPPGSMGSAVADAL